MATAVWAAPAGASVYRTQGNGQNFYVSWTEYDPDDVLGIAGNVHIGFLFGWSDQYGTYFHGNVTDYDCDPGEVPGGGHFIAEEVVEVGADVATESAEEAVEAIVDSGAVAIDPDVVIEAVQDDVAEAVSETIEEEFEEFPACDYIQDRFLDGTDTVTFSVDAANVVLTVTGTLTVYGAGHGEPGDVLGRPPINMTITGGDWQKYKYTTAWWGEGYQYTDSREGTDFYGGVVSGAIGAMGFDDDPDDTSWGSFGTFKFRTVEQIRF